MTSTVQFMEVASGNGLKDGWETGWRGSVGRRDDKRREDRPIELLWLLCYVVIQYIH